MSNVSLVVKELKDALNTITSYPVDWEGITVSITAKSYVERVTVTKLMEYEKENGRWVIWEP